MALSTATVAYQRLNYISIEVLLGSVSAEHSPGQYVVHGSTRCPQVAKKKSINSSLSSAKSHLTLSDPEKETLQFWLANTHIYHKSAGLIVCKMWSCVAFMCCIVDECCLQFKLKAEGSSVLLTHLSSFMLSDGWFSHRASAHACEEHCTWRLCWTAFISVCIVQTAFIIGFTVVKGKIKKAQWEWEGERERERERDSVRKEREHPVRESLPENNSVCFQLKRLQETLCHVLSL